MKIIKKIVIIGTSDGIILDKVVMKSLNLKRGDLVEVNVKKITKLKGGTR